MKSNNPPSRRVFTLITRTVIPNLGSAEGDRDVLRRVPCKRTVAFRENFSAKQQLPNSGQPESREI